MDDLIEGVLVTLKALFLILVSTIRNLFPTGILPRKNVRGQVVLVTGSGSGLGRLMAYEFGRLGARIVLWDINETGNQETLKELESRGVEVSGLDVSHLLNISLKLHTKLGFY
ncbi:unnamed protein product [Caenorhabditis sp. 36 PRJEB53466]|nr:unnamed protein product [Caenorhabditis sp. 36 PRJEB53466]